jgi:hypothetical protein
MEEFGFVMKKKFPKRKKIYREPVLRVYGEIRLLTGTTNHPKHSTDGGSSGTMTKTS